MHRTSRRPRRRCWLSRSIPPPHCSVPPPAAHPRGPVSPCWGVPRDLGAADTSVPPPAAPSLLGPAPGSAGGSARRDLLSRFIADIIFYCHIKAEAPVALWLPHRRLAPRCSAPRSRLLTLRFSGHSGDGALPRPPSPCTGATTGPTASTLGTRLVPSAAVEAQLVPNPALALGLGKIRGCQHLQNRVTLSPTWHGKGVCRPGLASFGPSICGTPSPCTPMGAPVCRGRGAGVVKQGQRSKGNGGPAATLRAPSSSHGRQHQHRDPGLAPCQSPSRLPPPHPRATVPVAGNICSAAPLPRRIRVRGSCQDPPASATGAAPRRDTDAGWQGERGRWMGLDRQTGK